MIVQTYVPNYRVPFFSGLVDNLRTTGIDCTVAVTGVRGSAKARGDAASGEAWMRGIEGYSIRPLPAGPELSAFRIGRVASKQDALVLGLLGTSLSNYAALLTWNAPIGLWGHVKSYVGAPSKIDRALETWQLRRADHVFAYTPQGAQDAIARGVRMDRVTAVMNSVDVDGLLAEVNSFRDAEIGLFLRENGLVPGKVFGVVGALDAPKRVDLLAEALDELWVRDPEVRVLVGGAGVQEGILAQAARRGQALMMGHVGLRRKALILRCSQALLNPGRIGLLAVEALATGTPILTTDLALHAPEFEYLVEGESVYSASGRGQDSLADLTLAHRGEYLPSLRPSWHFPGLEAMIENFAVGVRRMLSAS